MTWFERVVERVRGMDPRIVDGAFAAFAVPIALVTVFQENLDDGMREPDALAVVLAIAICATIALRRATPLLALTLGSALILFDLGRDYPEGLLPVVVFVLTYSVAAWSSSRRAGIGLATVWLTLVVLGLLDTAGLDAVGVVGNIAIYSVAWCMGFAIRTRRQSELTRLAEAEERAEAERQRAARIVAEERLRIAQELHDVVAHSMSVIAVQAGVGSHVLDEQPEQARAALDAISATSRGTLSEMRRLLGVLRNDDGARAHTPAPCLADVPKLVEDVRALGLPVELSVEGTSPVVHPGVELSAYRVVQEALTNVLKHAGVTRSIAVRLQHLPGQLTVEVVDDGRGTATPGTPSGAGGHGLVGMRERVELWGGELSAGPAPGGGYRIRALLPHGEDAT